MQSCTLYNNFSINHSLTSRYKFQFLVLIQSFFFRNDTSFVFCLFVFQFCHSFKVCRIEDEVFAVPPQRPSHIFDQFDRRSVDVDVDSRSIDFKRFRPASFVRRFQPQEKSSVNKSVP